MEQTFKISYIYKTLNSRKREYHLVDVKIVRFLCNNIKSLTQGVEVCASPVWNNQTPFRL